MPPTKRLPALLLLAVLLLSLYAWFGLGGTPTLPQPAKAAATVPTVPPSGRSSPPTQPVATVSLPLPSRDAPVDEVAITLQQRADGGDRKAACRLGIELLRCQRVLVARPGIQAHLAEARAPGSKAVPAVSMRAMEQHLAFADACSLLPPELVANGAAYLRQAALAGEPEAMLRYADGQSLDTGTGYGYLRTPQFDQWRAEAPAMLQRALAAGRPEAVHLLLQAHGGDQGLLASLVPDDALQAHAYLLLQRRLFGSAQALPQELVPAGLDSAARQRAEQLAADWHEDMFDNQRLDFMTSLHGLSAFFDPLGISQAAFEGHAYCEPVEPRSDG